MKPLQSHLPSFFLGAFCLIAGTGGPVRAAVVTIDRTVSREDVTFTRGVIEDLSPLPGHTFVDTLTVASGPVTISGGDTVQFRVVLREPWRFSISPNVGQNSTFFGQTGKVEIDLFLQTSASDSVSVVGHPFPGPAVTLLSTQNVATPSSSAGATFGTYTADALSGAVLHLKAGVGFPGVAFFSDPTQPGLFAGFEGSFSAPADMPRTTFDRAVSLSVSGSMRGQDPPPPLAEVVAVPEPRVGWLILVTGCVCCRRRRASPRESHLRA